LKVADIAVTYLGGFGDDLTVVNAARVSFEKESTEFSTSDEKLIAYLARHKHFSPFNHAFLSFRVKAPIFVARQLVKHKFMPWNEVSRRYVDSEPEFYIPDFRGRAENVKQGSGEVIEHNQMHRENYVDYCRVALNAYNWMLADGVCPEQARMALPLNTMTEWIWSGTLGAFLDMLVLRLDPHTQYESRVVAEQIAAHVKEHFPVSFNARINA
jgi:thymidylate synthase (FAD)